MLRSVSDRIDRGSPGVCVWEIGQVLSGLCFFPLGNPSVVVILCCTDMGGDGSGGCFSAAAGQPHHSITLGECPFNGPLSGTKYTTRAASPIQNASTPKSSLPFSKHRSCALLCAGFSRTLHPVSYFVYF